MAGGSRKSAKPQNRSVVTLQDRLESLFEVGRLLATYDDLDTLLSRILGEVHEVMQANAASMLLRVPGTDLLEFVNVRGDVAEQLQTQRLRIGQGISGEVARTRTILNVPNAYEDPRFNPSFDKASGFVTKQILAAPMVFRDTVVGVMSVMNRRCGEAFDADDERILSIFCDQAAIAVINAQEKRKYEQKNRAITVFAREIGRILSSELTLVYGYLHQTRRFLSKNLGSEHAWLLDKVNVPLAAVERSTDSLVRISKTLGVFTRSTENVNTEIISVNEALGYFLRETKYHRVRVYVEGSGDVKMRLPMESLFLVLESLIESFVAPLPKDVDFYGRLFLMCRERVDHADFRICATEDLVAEVQACESSQTDGQNQLSLATIESIVDSFDAELLDSARLASSRTAESLLSQARPFRSGASEETVFNQLVQVRWQLAIPLSDAAVPKSQV